MDYIPTVPDGDDWFRIVAIDPGTSTLGLAVLDWKWGTEKAVVRWAYTVKATNGAESDSFEEMCGKRDARLEAIAEVVSEVIEFAFPNFVITETSFSQRGKLSAYEAGVEANKMLRGVLWDFSPAMPLHGVDPRRVKNFVGVSHVNTTKDDMRNAVMELYKDSTDIALDVLDEHSIDAVAVGNFFVRHFLLSLESLYVPAPRKPSSGKRMGRRRRRRGKKK